MHYPVWIHCCKWPNYNFCIRSISCSIRTHTTGAQVSRSMKWCAIAAQWPRNPRSRLKILFQQQQQQQQMCDAPVSSSMAPGSTSSATEWGCCWCCCGCVARYSLAYGCMHTDNTHNTVFSRSVARRRHVWLCNPSVCAQTDSSVRRWRWPTDWHCPRWLRLLRSSRCTHISTSLTTYWCVWWSAKMPIRRLPQVLQLVNYQCWYNG